MPNLPHSQRLYDQIRDSHPDWLPLLNASFCEIYKAGEDDGYHSSTCNQSGILATLGLIYDASNYTPLFPVPDTAPRIPGDNTPE